MKKVLRIVIILLVVLAMAALVVKRKKEAKMVKPYGMRPVTVHVAEVRQRPLEKAHSYLGVAEAQQALDDEHLKYDAGKNTVNDVLDAEAARLLADSQYSQARHEEAIAWYNLQLAAGTPLQNKTINQ